MSLLSLLGLLGGKPDKTPYEVETFYTKSGTPVTITLIKHGTLAISYKDKTIHIDPVSGYGKPTDYVKEFPKADVIIVTHEHGDHLDKDAIAALSEKGRTKLITNADTAEKLGWGTVMKNGDSGTILGEVTIDAVPAYNYTKGHTQFHPKGRDNGFVLTFDGLRIYIAGDTEDIPEMAALKDIDIAFLPVNQPYTMTVEQCVNAANIIKPKVLIPYHFGKTDLSQLPELLPGIKVLIRQMQ
jgi:L-ascorbate metabolism protein UlaG (beta-lactamase superfamily)